MTHNTSTNDTSMTEYVLAVGCRIFPSMNILSPPGRVVGAGPLFRQIADDIGLVDVINRQVRWDARQCRVSPGERILVMILDVLTGKSPLYRVIERWTVTDVAVMAGAGRVAADFSDDSLGRALDKLGRAQPARIFSVVLLLL